MLDPDVTRRELGAYADAVASATPAPGGGSVAATTGAFAAALLEMVLSLTLAGSPDERDVPALRAAALEASGLRTQLFELAAADEQAYTGFRAALALPKETSDERARRAATMQSALAHAADVPLKTAFACRAVIHLSAVAVERGTRHALSDVVTARLLSHAAAESALLNVYVNAKLIKDVERRTELLVEADAMRESITQATAHAERAFAARDV